MMTRRLGPFVLFLAVGAILLPRPALAQDAAAAADAKKHSAIRLLNRDGGRHRAMNARVKEGNVDLLMIGDSITQAWEGPGKAVWKKYYGKRNAVNLGISGDRTGHVLWRLENGNIDGISPKLAVIMIGTNNSGSNTPEQIAEGVTAIVSKLRTALPEMQILLLGIFPRGTNDQDKRRQVVMKTNEIISKLDAEEMVTYLDIGEKFLDEKRVLSRKVMPDLLHLSPAAYETWSAAIEPTVATLMGEK
jgi:lysophospholipase L1-like esterase